ncbi:hypothetical protein ACIA8H_12980 [Streptomyces goshikiensis]|uniref:hypothetical protein n=1 Tax=Streptomyces goshikiensis TaxID=1942 RepID=UPI0037A84493
MSAADAPTEMEKLRDTRPGPLIARTTAGAGHIAVFLAHWAGGHTVSREELLRRIAKDRGDAHTEAVEENQREARRAHKKATKLRRIAAEDGGLVPAAQVDLDAAEHKARRHEIALEALGDFEPSDIDPGQVRHRRRRICAINCTILSVPATGVVLGSWLLDGVVLLVASLGAVTACAARGDNEFDLTTRPVPADLLAETAHLVLGHSEESPVLMPIDPGEWKRKLRAHVEQTLAIAKHEGRNGVHAAEILQSLQTMGEFVGMTSSAFPSKLRDAGIPTKVVSVAGDKQLGVQYAELEKALGHMPRLPVHLVPDLTETIPIPSPNSTGQPR